MDKPANETGSRVKTKGRNCGMKKAIAILAVIILCVTLCGTAFADDSWTIFVYLCGADLESEGSLATDNMQEMIDASKVSNVRFVVQTGGAAEWHNGASANELDRFEVVGGASTIVDRQPQASMGDSATLEGFLRWGLAAYPSAHVGLVFWDHGSGSINGVCFDELSDNDSLTLRDIDKALSNVQGALPGGFDFIGFDACLMGTLESASILAPYAKYMIGSQEVEPGSGWDYAMIGNCLAADPSADMVTLGKAICDGFYQMCVENECGNSSTLALTDLSKIEALRAAFELYAQDLYQATEDEANFVPIVRAIISADNFGGNNRSEGYTNMVDLGGLIDAGIAWSPNAKATRDALADATVYQVRGTDHQHSSGLSVYYPLEVQGSMELKIFRDVCVSTHYLALVDKIAYGFANGGSWAGYSENTPWDWDSMVPDSGQSTVISFQQEPALDENGRYYFVLSEQGLYNTASVEAKVYMLSADEQDYISLGYTSDVLADWATGVIEDDFDGYWFSLPDGQNLSANYVDEGDGYDLFTSPVNVNGEDTNLRFAWYFDTGEIQILDLWDGVDENGIAARSETSLKPGDRIVPRFDAINPETYEETEYTGEEYVWGAGDNVTFGPLPDGAYLYAFVIDDIFGGSYETEFAGFALDQGHITYQAA